ENPGRVVEKQELLKRLWPDTYVEEANVTFNIKRLRKALGDDAHSPHYIETVTRRGYRFIAEVEDVLSNSNSVSRQMSQSHEIANAQSADSHNQLSRQGEAQAAEPSSESANRQSSLMPETQYEAQPASRPASMSTGKRSVALAAATGIVVACIAIFLWEFS